MLKIIRSLLIQFINDIDSNNSNITEDEQKEIINLIQRINSDKLTKIESAEYIGVSRATFDNYINKGLIPKGEKERGSNQLRWNKFDLDNYLNKYGRK